MIKTELIRFLNNAFPVQVAKGRYRKWFKEELNLVAPQDLNAKVLWLSLFSDTREWSRLSDKYAVREFLRERGCEQYLVKLYGKWDKIEDIDWDSLPKEFILKSNTSCGLYKIVKDKKQLDLNAVKEELKAFIAPQKAPYSSEWHYQRIKPCIIAEELLKNDDTVKDISTTSIIDYKIWCFNGGPFNVFVGANRTRTGLDCYLYTTEWKNISENIVYGTHGDKPKTDEIPRPQNLKEMLELAETLSAGFPLVRVDLYHIGGKVYFGEMTFTSNGGIMPYFDYQYCKEMGSHIDISMIKKDPEHWRGKGSY